jgi:deoxyribonucleoside regulator
MRDARRRRLVEVAEMYHLDGRSMLEIARETGLSRSTVSRMLRQAVESGVVEVTVHSTELVSDDLARRLRDAHGVDVDVVVVPDDVTGIARLDEVAQHGAQRLTEVFGGEMTLVVPWGTSVAAVARQLTPRRAPGSRVVQLNGSGNTFTSGLTYAASIFSLFGAAFGSSVHPFPVPAFFDRAETKAAMWQERSLARVISLQRNADVALFSVGSLGSEVPGHLYRAGYLERADLDDLRAHGVVGDLGSVFLRADGTSDGIALNERTSGMPIEDLRRVPRRILVATGRAKAQAVRAALLAHAVTDLVVDDHLAQAVVDLDRRPSR